jgi:chloride channel 3/4/5
VPVAKLLFNLASPCETNEYDTLGLCPATKEEIMPVVSSLAVAFLIKGTLTIITFGIVSTELWLVASTTDHL